jgi:lysozyme family protein
MNLSFIALEPSIVAQLAAAKVTRLAVATQIATKVLLPHKERFLAVEKITGVPAIWMMPVFYREEPNFNTYFGNGDPLDAPTKHVPQGRGPFSTWEDGTVDALQLDHITDVDDWSWARMTYQWESWNGFGVRQYHGRPSGYVWSGTDQYLGGKYVHDGPSGWSPGTWDKQLGCVAIARALVTADPSLEESIVRPAVA